MSETLFFDGDQTLWDFDTLMRRALQATLQELRVRCPGVATARVDVDSMVADRQAAAIELGRSETNMERLRRAAFQRTLTRLQLQDDELAAHLTRFYLERRFNAVDLYPDALVCLTDLSAKYKLGLLSNGNSHPPQRLTRRRWSAFLRTTAAPVLAVRNRDMSLLAGEGCRRRSRGLAVMPALRQVAGLAGAPDSDSRGRRPHLRAS
jgi:FMN phosphatase YigB (HAD superfamily)